LILHGNTLFVSTIAATDDGSTAACRMESAPPIEFPPSTTRPPPRLSMKRETVRR
jgi:hypothetical protein